MDDEESWLSWHYEDRGYLGLSSPYMRFLPPSSPRSLAQDIARERERMEAARAARAQYFERERAFQAQQERKAEIRAEIEKIEADQPRIVSDNPLRWPDAAKMGKDVDL